MKTLPVNLASAVAEFEREYLLLAIEQSKGNGAEAARLLGLNYTQWRYQLAKLNRTQSALTMLLP